eukprot:m.27305 g.27305  ORF g.27305 m.27305 type:complete len:465 (+) comp4411_c0_seq2:13-1407(+)
MHACWILRVSRLPFQEVPFALHACCYHSRQAQGRRVQWHSRSCVVSAWRHEKSEVSFRLSFQCGYSFDKLVPLHRWLGMIVLICITIHMGACFVAGGKGGHDRNGNSSSSEGSVNDTFVNRSTRYFFGFLSWLALALLAVLSSPPIRRQCYELFKYPHLVLMLLFFLFGIIHMTIVILFAVLGLLPWVVDKFIQCCRCCSSRPAAADLSSPDLLKLSIPKVSSSTRVGQYIFLNIPKVSRLQWHPFSLTSSPAGTEDQIAIRPLGAYTREVGSTVRESIRNNEAVEVHIDGPYGSAEVDMVSYPVGIYVAGGVGITPVISVLRLIYGIVDDPTPSGRIGWPSATAAQPRSKHIYLIWSVSSEEQVLWFADILALAMARSIQAEHVPLLHLEVHVTKKMSSQPTTLRSGRPDVGKRITDIVQSHQVPASVFTCGPASLVNATWDVSNYLMSQGYSINFHRETFEF